MTDIGYVLASIAAAGLVTFLIRATPFLGARWLRKSPIVHQVGQFLPPAIMTLLLVHSIRELGESAQYAYMPETVAVLVVIVLQWKLRQPLLSIAVGTASYVLWRYLTL
jgi:branched-subunit amino acid transport protein AzlD